MNHSRVLLCGVLMGAGGAMVQAAPPSALPTGGQVIAGSGQIDQHGSELTVTQSSSRLIASWSTFDIGSEATVRFVQPSVSSVAFNRILDANPSQIFGHLTANGRVFLLNPNGILFGSSAQVNVGGLVASSLHLSDEDFLSGHYAFTNAGHAGPVENRGSLEARGGVVALIAPQVRNSGTIRADRGSAVLAAGDTVNLDFQGDGLVTVDVDRGAFDALAENQGLIQADGGQVVMTAKGASALLDTVVNNEGVIRAQTLENRDGRILLLGGMEHDRVRVGGTLDASAPNGGNGGFIETSAAEVTVNDSTVTTLARDGKTGNWLIDPNDYTIAAAGGDITGAALAAALNSTDVTIETTTQGTAGGNGDIFVNDAIAKTTGTATTLTLLAERNIEINQPVSSSTGRLNVVLTTDTDANHTGDVLFAATGSVSTFGGNFFSAGMSGEAVVSAGQAFTMAPGSYVDVGNGRAWIYQEGDITLGERSLRSTRGEYYTNAGNSGGRYNFTLLQTAGDILTTNTDPTKADIFTASDLTLAGSNIGAAAAGEQIKVSGPTGQGSATSAFPSYAPTLFVTNGHGSSYVNEIGTQIFGTINVNIGNQVGQTQNIQILGDAGGTGHVIVSTDGAGVVQLASGDINTSGIPGFFDAGTPANSTDPAIFPTNVVLSAANITLADHAVELGGDTFYWVYPGNHSAYPSYTHASFNATAWDTISSVSNNGIAKIDALDVTLRGLNLGTSTNPVEVGSGSVLSLENTGGSTFVKVVDDSFDSISLFNFKDAGTHSVLFSGGDHIDYTTDGNGIVVPTLGARSDGSSFATTTGIDTSGNSRSVTLTAISGDIEYDTNSVDLGGGALTSTIDYYDADINGGPAIHASHAKDGLAEITAGNLTFNLTNVDGEGGSIENIEFAQGGSSSENSLMVYGDGGDIDLTELTPNHIKSLFFSLEGANRAQHIAVDLAGSDDLDITDDGSLIVLDATHVNLAANDRGFAFGGGLRNIQIDGASFGSGDYSVGTGALMRLNGDVLTDGGQIGLSAGGGIELMRSVRIDSNADDATNSASTGSAGLLYLNGAVSATAAGHVLTVDSSSTTGSAGVVYLTGNAGNAGGASLGGLTIDASGASGISDGNVILFGSQFVVDGDLSVSGQVSLGGVFTTTGSQTYDGLIQLSRNTVMTTSGQDVTFNTTIDDGSTHAHALEVNAGAGTVTFAGVVGGYIKPFALYVTGNTVIEADMSFARAEFFSPVTIGADLTLTQACCYGLHFHDTVDGAHALTVNSDGLSFDGAVGGFTALTSLTVTGPTFLGSNVTTSGLQTYNGDVSLRASSTLTLTGPNADFTLQASSSILNVSGGNIDFGIETTGDIVLGADSAISSSAGEMNVALHGGSLAMGAHSTVSANGGDIDVRANAFSADSTARLQSSGSLTVAPHTAGTTVGIAGGAGTLALSTTNLTTNFVDGFSSLTFGSSSAGSLTVGGPIAFDESLTLQSGDDIHLNGALTGTGQTLTLQGGTGASVSGSGTITASGLLLLGDADYALSSGSGHHVGTLAAAGVSSVDFRNNGSLSIGTVAGTEGIDAANNVTVEARGATADLTLTKPVESIHGDIVLAAGRNFINSNASGTGIDADMGRYLVYSADPGASTEGMNGYSKHYNQTYTAGSAPDYADSGSWFLYSMAPVLSVAPNDSTATYGNTPSIASGLSGFIDGDTADSAGIDGEAGYLIAGPTSSSGHTSAGVHEVSYTGGLASSLGYTFQDDASSTQELTVERKALTLAGLTAADKPFDGNTSATVTSFGSAQGVLDGDAIDVDTASAQAAFADAHIGTGKTVTVTDFGLSGADAGNYLMGDQGAIADISNSGPDIAATGHGAALDALTTGLLTVSAHRNGTADTALNAAAPGGKGASASTIRPGSGEKTLADVEADRLVTDATVSVAPADCSGKGDEQLPAGCREGPE